MPDKRFGWQEEELEFDDQEEPMVQKRDLFFQTWGFGQAAGFFETIVDADATLAAMKVLPGSRTVVKAEASVRISKPETTAAYHRIPIRPMPDNAEIRTITISEDQGIKALEDIRSKQVVTYLFDTDKWTMERAKTWAEEHKQAAGDEKPVEKAATFRFLKIDKKEHIVGGLVYEPNVRDTQDDYTDAPEIQKAMYRFMLRYAVDQKRIKVMHKGQAHYFPILEVFQPEHDTKKGDQVIPAGAWWMMVKVTSPDVWTEVEEGRLTGFSIGGRASTP